MNRTSHRVYVLTLVSAVLLGHAPAYAQDGGSNGADTPPKEPIGGIEEIVVTAQRRSENLQNTPIAVTALKGDTLEARNVRTTQDLMQQVPGLEVSTQTTGDGGASAVFFLRGFGQENELNGSQPAVGIYIDDFYFPSLEGAVLNVLDFSQIEVLRGPQGTLFGRNTIGGAIRYTTVKPQPSLGGYLTGTFGSFGRKDVTGAANIPLNSIMALRLTGGRLEDDGFVRRQIGGKAGGSVNALGRAQLRITPSSDVTIDLTGQYSHSRYDGFAYRLPGPFDGQLAFPFNNFTPIGHATPYDDRYKSKCDYCQPGGTDSATVENYSTSGVIAWRLNDAITIKSLTGYTHVGTKARVDLDGTVLPLLNVSSAFVNHALSQEIQINGRSLNDALHWVTGLYYFDGTYNTSGIDGIQITVLGNPIPDAKTDRFTHNYAGYADLTYQVTPKLSVLGGFRYSYERVHATTVQSPNGPSSAATTHFSSPIGRLGVQYQWTPDVMSYATVSQGFRSGGFNRENNGVLQAFSPEKDLTYEVGGRFTLFDRRLRLNPTLFYNKWKDIQVQRVVFGPMGELTLLENAARAHTYGAELEAEAALTDALRLYGHIAILHAKYDSIGTATGIALDSGFQRAPKFSGGVGASYTAALGQLGSLSGSVDFSWQGKQYSTPSNNVGPAGDALLLPSYNLTNLRLQYKTRNDEWQVAAFATNIFDKTYFVGGVNYDQTTPHYDLGRPRELGVTVRRAF